VPVTDELQCCLGVPIRAAEYNGIQYLAEVQDMDDLRECSPDLDAIAQLDAEGLIVTTAKSCGPYDFASRYFWPRLGLNEDPVTGSMHCMLAPYWASILGKTRFCALQASARQGVLDVHIADDRVFIGGAAVTTMRGMIELEEESYALVDAA